MQDGRRGRPRSARSRLARIGGALNGWLIARWSLPPLMVTLGSLSLFRGLAEGLTGGIENYTGLPPRFLALGQGFLGAVPAQAPWLLLAALAVLGRGPSHDARPRVLRDRPQPGGVTARGARRHQAPLRAVCRLGSARRAGGYHLRGAPGSGQGGRGHGLRAHRHHGRRPGRHGDQRRQRHHRRHADRADGDGGAAERPAARRAAGRTGGRAHGRAAGRRDRRAARGGAAGVASGAGGRRGDAELSARRPVRRHRGQRVPRRGHQLVARAIASARAARIDCRGERLSRLSPPPRASSSA